MDRARLSVPLMVLLPCNNQDIPCHRDLLLIQDDAPFRGILIHVAHTANLINLAINGLYFVLTATGQ